MSAGVSDQVRIPRICVQLILLPLTEGFSIAANERTRYINRIAARQNWTEITRVRQRQL